jgi:Baseplate J-like protein
MKAKTCCQPCQNQSDQRVVVRATGQEALLCRVGTHATFLEAMKQRLSSSAFPGLRPLTTRDSSDPAIALLDAWATVADVLTFYQERITNESYLRTATERRSLIELARLVGYHPRPGVAASTYLAFNVEGQEVVEIPAGTKAQSLPDPGQLPQNFETAEPLRARSEWNAMRPRLTQPQVLDASNAAAVSPLYLQGVATNLKPNDPILIVPGEPGSKAVPRWVEEVEPQPAAGRTKVALQLSATQLALARIVDERLDRPTSPAAAVETTTPMLEARMQIHPLLKLPQRLPVAEQWRRRKPAEILKNIEVATNLFPKLQPTVSSEFRTALANSKTSVTEPQIVAFRVRAAPFGHNAPLKPIYDERGKIIGTAEWPLAGSETIQVRLAAPAERGLLDSFVPGSVQAQVMFVHNQEVDSTVLLLQAQNQQPLGLSGGPATVTVEPQPTVGPDGATILADTLTAVTFVIGLHQIAIRPDSATQTFGISIDGNVLQRTVAAGQRLCVRADDRVVEIVFAATGSSLNISIEAPSDPLTAMRRTITLDAVYERIIPGSAVLIVRDQADGGRPIETVAIVDRVQTVSRADYGVTGKVTELTLAGHGGLAWIQASDHSLAALRRITIYAQAEALNPADAPIDTPEWPPPIQDGSNELDIELDRLYPALEAGRLLTITGERTDLATTSGVMASELVMVAAVGREETAIDQLGRAGQSSAAGAGTVQASRVTSHTTLTITPPLTYTFKPETVTICGNVVRATQGETREEVLGSGDGSVAGQQFSLKQTPLTYVAASTPNGAESTLKVYVDGVRWYEDEHASLHDLGRTDRGFITRTDQAGQTSIIFGDGLHGARLPTGTENVVAQYRFGMGKDGNVRAGLISQLAARPLGVKEVVNPQPATGGADQESEDLIRYNIPLVAQSFGRVVSVADYAAFARTFAGIGKAYACRITDQQYERIHLTIAGIDDEPILASSDLLTNLDRALQEQGDPYQPFKIDLRELLLLVISAGVRACPEYRWKDLEPCIRSRLHALLCFQRRDLGQPVLRSEVISAIQNVPGVAYVDVNIFGVVSEAEATSPANLRAALDHLVATPNQKVKPRIPVNSTWIDDTGQIHPAQLAYLDPNLPDTLILQELSDEYKS